MQLAEAVKAAKAAEKSAKVLKASLKQYVVAHFGESNPAIVDFGYSPRKVAQKTVAEKVSDGGKAARHARCPPHVGSQQKAAIHGQVETPAPQPQPAAAPIAQPVVTNGTSGVTQSLLAQTGGLSFRESPPVSVL